MTKPVRLFLVPVLAILLAGCGDKVPESEAARKVGSAPKATVDKVIQETGAAVQQGADRTREAEESGR